MFVEFEKLPYPSVTSISVMLNVLPHITKLHKHEYAIMQRITITSTRYHTFSLILTRVGYNATRYHNFNALPHALPYILSEICLFLGYLQQVTTRYRQFFQKILIYICFINLTVMRGNALQIA